MSQEAHLKKLILTTSRRLQKFKEQQVLKGSDTPPGVLIEIEDLEAQLEQFEAELAQLPVPEEALSESSSVSANDSASLKQNQEPSAGNNKKMLIWTAIIVPIILALIGFGGIVFQTVWNGGGNADPTSNPTIEDFTYQVHVRVKDTGEDIPNAIVTIEVGGKAPLDGVTDSTGLARIFVSASHAGRPGRLIVEVDGYGEYRKEIDLTEGALPKDVFLEPEP